MKPLSLFLTAALTVYLPQAFAHESGSVLAERRRPGQTGHAPRRSTEST